jgi:bleomycin hydrolase
MDQTEKGHLLMSKFHWYFILASVVMLGAFVIPQATAQVPQSSPTHDKVLYQKHVEDPVLKEMEDRDKSLNEAADKKSKTIEDQQEEIQKKEKDIKQDLRFDLQNIQKPSSPDAFKVQGWHFPPEPQFLSNTCWSFSTTSYFESEIYRITGQRILLSKIWTVYYEYLEKARRFIDTRGSSLFDEGSESEAIPRIWRIYGIVPAAAYPGLLAKDSRHDHAQMIQEMKQYLEFCKAHKYWESDQILDSLKIIMRKYLGDPPTSFTWKGKAITPRRFLSEVCKLDMDQYVAFMSTTSVPFWTKGEYKMPDNWWHEQEYHNIPLDAWYDLLLRSVQAGSTAAIGGDVSEPGYNGYEKIAVVPSFDIPREYIDQDARELRIYNQTTTDDHGVHLVGWMKIDGEDWFLIKDSARASRKAKPEGYLYYRADYLKLKMLTFSVHKNFAKDVLGRFQSKMSEQKDKEQIKKP